MRCNPRREPTVDDWQAERVAQIGLDADRRRDEHRSEGAAAIARIKGRGESIASIAATQALGGEQAEEHGGRSAPIGDAGASTRRGVSGAPAGWPRRGWRLKARNAHDGWSDGVVPRDAAGPVNTAVPHRIAGVA